MATKIKRCLYVGLGGTGMNALLHTKKTFIDTYGEVPPMIGFLGIDTDSGAYKKTLLSVRGEDIRLDPNEQMPILCAEPRPIYSVHKDEFSWLPEKNLYALDGMTLGAGQVRTNGRFAFTVNYVDVCAKVRSMLNQITNARIVDNDRYELLSTNTEIHMVFSVCGGTGCGTFLNMAYLLRQEAPQCKLTGYAVLPDIFKSMSHGGMSRVAPNAYGAIVDLDYLMHLSIGSKPFKLEYINDSVEINSRPFDSVLFIDNRNEQGDTYTQIEQVSEMISLALVTSAGELSSASASVSDNLSKNITEGTMDIENKKAWAAGMGICELVYRNHDLSMIYATKAAHALIERLFNSVADVDTIADAWIDAPEVNIRENNNSDHVIDFVADKRPKYEISINEYANPMPEVEQYLQVNKINDEDVTVKVRELTTRVRGELRKLLVKHINAEGGVTTCFNLLENIASQVDVFMGEMVNEKTEFNDKMPRYRTTLDAMVADLKAYDGKIAIFKTKSKMEEHENNVIDAARALCVCQREIVRRDAAIQVFNSVKAMLEEAKAKIKAIQDVLLAVKQILSDRLARLQNGVGRSSQIFQIDLSQNMAKTLKVNLDEVLVSEFVKTLSGDKKLYELAEYSSDEVDAFIMSYTTGLHTARQIAATTIDDVVNKLSDEEFERTLKLAISKSMPLFRYNYRGHMPKEQPHDSYYIGVPDKKVSRLCADDAFKGMIPNTADCDFSSIGVTDKIIIYRQIGVVPAYAIAGINDYHNEYDDCNANCHIDYNLQMRMEREDFDLQPKRTTDDDLLDLWVKGFIFGLVKNEDGEYMFQSEEHGDALDDYWVSLGNYRDEAFDKFRSFKHSVRKEFNERLEAIANSRGADAINALLSEVRAAYLEKFSQINMTRDEIKKKGFEKIRQLITDELTLAKKL
ncbi:MAG: hypothetical protein IJR13_07145 [Bacteroidales bacterium]|nr:hypothetical protein [Bacteroidales bacterium]